MSHFTRIKTALVKKEHIVQALRDLGYKPAEGDVQIRGYGGQKTSVDIMIETKNVGYDIGFAKAGGHYEIVADWYGIKDINQEKFIKQLQQRYAYNVVWSNMQEKGFELVEEEKQQDNTIHLTLRRTVF